MEYKDKKPRPYAKEDLVDSKIPFTNFLDLEKPRNMGLFVIIRILLALTATYELFHPDENGQAMNIAYGFVFGDTTNVPKLAEWSEFYCLRDVSYAYLLALPMYILRILGLDYRIAIYNAPFLTQALLISIGDYYLYKVAKH